MSRAVATVLGLKGAQRIVLEELGRSLRQGDDVSVMLLANRTNYCTTRVWTALQDLQELDQTSDRSRLGGPRKTPFSRRRIGPAPHSWL
jgi:hypothetical protein